MWGGWVPLTNIHDLFSLGWHLISFEMSVYLWIADQYAPCFLRKVILIVCVWFNKFSFGINLKFYFRKSRSIELWEFLHFILWYKMLRSFNKNIYSWIINFWILLHMFCKEIHVYSHFHHNLCIKLYKMLWEDCEYWSKYLYNQNK